MQIFKLFSVDCADDNWSVINTISITRFRAYKYFNWLTTLNLTPAFRKEVNYLVNATQRNMSMTCNYCCALMNKCDVKNTSNYVANSVNDITGVSLKIKLENGRLDMLFFLHITTIIAKRKAELLQSRNGTLDLYTIYSTTLGHALLEWHYRADTSYPSNRLQEVFING
jgi:hypothetical protein